jgi:hypothetical protein
MFQAVLEDFATTDGCFAANSRHADRYHVSRDSLAQPYACVKLPLNDICEPVVDEDLHPDFWKILQKRR